jgi:hypothetical protein
MLSACGDRGAGDVRASERGRAEVGGTIVSTVNGHPISVADVRTFAEQAGLSPRESLERLQAELLLMGEAEERGVASPAIDRVAARARAQALLDAEAEAVRVSDAELRSAYERDPRFHRGEQRSSVHVLAKLSEKATPAQEQAARALLADARAAMGTLSPEAIVERYRGTRDGIELHAERLPPVERNGPFVKEFLQALFSRNDPGVIAEPVRTRFGLHAVRLLEITPARAIPFDEAAPTLRAEILLERRRAHTEALLTALRQKHGAKLDAEALEKLAAVSNE